VPNAQGVWLQTGIVSRPASWPAGLPGGIAELDPGGLIPAPQLNVLGTGNNPVTSASAARPTGLTRVFWMCATQPTNWVTNDEWIQL
jgi:hypothetical protein